MYKAIASCSNGSIPPWNYFQRSFHSRGSTWERIVLKDLTVINAQSFLLLIEELFDSSFKNKNQQISISISSSQSAVWWLSSMFCIVSYFNFGILQFFSLSCGAVMSRDCFHHPFAGNYFPDVGITWGAIAAQWLAPLQNTNQIRLKHFLLLVASWIILW